MPAAYAQHLAQRGLPPFVIDLLTSLHAAISAGEYAKPSADAAALAGTTVNSARAYLASV